MVNGTFEKFNLLISNINNVILGKNEEVLNVMKGILCNGHILIEDVPGTGKTLLVKTLAKSMELNFKRIQFNSDLMPSDVTGVSIFNPKENSFEFKSGPVFCNLLLADEINRATPKAQGALLEAMEEKQISEWNNTYKLQEPFIVLATENPVEQIGTYTLPEAQLDRFILKTKLGYVSEETELNILKKYKDENPLDNVQMVLSKKELMDIQEYVRNIKVNESIQKYIIDIISATRHSEYIELGCSTRAALYLQKIAQANAFMFNREYVIPEDVKNNVSLVLSHRIILSFEGKKKFETKQRVIEEILKTVPQRI